MVKIFLVDDHALVRMGIKRLIEDVDGLKVVAEADNGVMALDMLVSKKVKPDVILMDLSMPEMNGIEATRKIRSLYPKLPIIIITVHTHEPFPSSAMKVGANGYLHKGCTIEELAEGVNAVVAGERFLSDEISRALAMRLLDEYEASPFDALSSREKEVLHLMALGRKNGEIANELDISPKTISTYRYRILGKLGVKSRINMLKMLKQFGFYPEGQEPPGIFDKLPK